MDTPTALSIIQTEVEALQIEILSHQQSIDQKTTKMAALTVASNQLQGLLDTPSVDLVVAKEKIDDLTVQLKEAQHETNPL